jgi:hypothetical protein
LELNILTVSKFRLNHISINEMPLQFARAFF